MDIICRELRSGDITKALEQYESDDEKNKGILVPLLADYLNTSENDHNKELINNLNDFGPIQCALCFYRADFDTISADLKKYKAALPKATYSGRFSKQFLSALSQSESEHQLENSYQWKNSV